MSTYFLGGHVNTSNNTHPDRRRRRTHSTEFKAKVVAACRKPRVSIAAVALDYRLNANLVRRWVVADEHAAKQEAREKLQALLDTARPERVLGKRAERFHILQRHDPTDAQHALLLLAES